MVPRQEDAWAGNSNYNPTKPLFTGKLLNAQILDNTEYDCTPDGLFSALKCLLLEGTIIKSLDITCSSLTGD